jgi:dolichol-phosphate mannosyltransferase
MVRFAWDAVTGFSVKPLTLPMRAGVACGFLATLTWALAGWWWLANGDVPSVGLLAGLVFLLAAGQFLTLGVIGEYLGRMYTEVRGRPMFLIEQVVRGRAVSIPAPVPPRREVA